MLVNVCAGGHIVNKCFVKRRVQIPSSNMSGGKHKTDNSLSDASDKFSGMTDDDKFSIEESKTDSGFISSGNLIVSAEIFSEEIGSSSKLDSDADANEPKQQNTSMRLDSGIYLGLSESFSSLSLQNKGLNDLNSGTIKSSSGSASVKPNVPGKPTEQTTSRKQPWELYYEQDEDGDTYLHQAIIQEFLEVAVALIRAAPVPRLLDTANDDAQTALHLAVATGQWKIARWLIVAGARPCPQNIQGDSPLHLAARLGDLYSCKAITDPVQQQERDLLDLKYPPQPYQQCDLDQWNYDGQTCVHVAAINGHVDVLRHLVWYGADINAREGKSGYTALHYAIERGDEKLAHFLLSECSRLNVDVVTYGGRSVLELGYPVAQSLEMALRSRGVPSPYTSDDEYDDDSDEEMMYEATNMFKQNLVINASA